MFCSKCGLKLTEEAKFCVRCGTKMLGYSGSEMNSVDPDAIKDDTYKGKSEYKELEDVLFEQMQAVMDEDDSEVNLQPLVYGSDKKSRSANRVVVGDDAVAYEKKAKAEAEEKARKEAEEKARKEAEEKIRREAEEKARKEAEEKARKEAEEKIRREAEEKARREAEEKARLEAEENAKLDEQMRELFDINGDVKDGSDVDILGGSVQAMDDGLSSFEDSMDSFSFLKMSDDETLDEQKSEEDNKELEIVSESETETESEDDSEKTSEDEKEEEAPKEPMQMVGMAVLYVLIGLAAFTGGIMLKAFFM